MEEPTVDIKGFEGLYAVTRDGRVFSYPKPKGFYKTSGYWLRGYKFKTGYVMLHLKKNKVDFNLLVHRAVADAYIPNPFKLPCVNHKDCNRSNNLVENLEWCTHKQNSEYMVSLKRNRTGETHHMSKLTDKKAAEIKRLYSGRGESLNTLARRFNVSKKTIFNIIHKKIWRHV